METAPSHLLEESRAQGRGGKEAGTPWGGNRTSGLPYRWCFSGVTRGWMWESLCSCTTAKVLGCWGKSLIRITSASSVKVSSKKFCFGVTNDERVKKTQIYSITPRPAFPSRLSFISDYSGEYIFLWAHPALLALPTSVCRCLLLLQALLRCSHQEPPARQQTDFAQKQS